MGKKLGNFLKNRAHAPNCSVRVPYLNNFVHFVSRPWKTKVNLYSTLLTHQMSVPVSLSRTADSVHDSYSRKEHPWPCVNILTDCITLRHQAIWTEFGGTIIQNLYFPAFLGGSGLIGSSGKVFLCVNIDVGIKEMYL
jgi:hypothetical protein